MIGLLGLALGGSLLAGCGTTQNLPRATEEKPTSDKALIIVEGSDSWAGIYKLYAVKMYDNKTLAGKLAPHGKLVWLRDPGPMVISLGSAYNGIDPCIGRRVTVAAGERYRFKVQCNSSLFYTLDGPGVPCKYSQPTRSSVPPPAGKPPVAHKGVNP